MSAGTGVQHSEFNLSGIAPSYEQKSFADAKKRGALRLVGTQGLVLMHADARLYASLLDSDETVTLALDPG